MLTFSFRPTLIAAILSASSALAVPTASADPAATALPTGGKVAAGAVQIKQAGAQMNIDQASPRAVINWQGFDVGRDAEVNIKQPDRNAAILNRVTTARPSEIHGKLKANGQVFVINPAGIVFGKDSQVNAGGIVASTLDIDDHDFMAGKHRFKRKNATGKIINRGKITAADGGYIALLAPELRNEGVLSARLGTVALAAGEAVTLALGDNVAVKVDPATVDTLIEQKAMIQAEGGRVILTAKAVNTLLTGAVNMSGSIEAGSITHKGGEVTLEGSGAVHLSGTINVAGATGGSVKTKGKTVTLAGARLDASGANGGGRIDLGDWDVEQTHVDAASKLDASATQRGDGGTITAIAKTTKFQGVAKARGGKTAGKGGLVETSGQQLEIEGARVDAGADQGAAGTWLLDPTTQIITAATAMNISDALVNNNVTITVAHVGSSECGVYSICSTDYISDLIIHSDAVINPTIRATATTLTLQADRNITFLEGALIQASGGKLNVILNSDFDADGVGAISMYSGSAIKSNGGSITLGGGATNTSGYPIGYATGYNAESEGCSASTCGDYHAGITLLDATLYSNNGTIQLSGRGDTGGGTGIDLRNTRIDAGNTGRITLKGEGVYSANSSGVGIAVYDNSILVAGANGINLSAKANVTGDINAQNSYALSLGDATATADTSTRIYTINGGQLTLDLETTVGTDDGSNWYFGDMMGYIGNVDQTGDISIAIKGSENANLALPNINTQGNLTLNSVGAIRDINNSIICASGICDISTYQSVSGTTTIDAVGSNVTLGSSSSFDTGKLVISNADTVFVETLGRTDLTLGNINANGSIFIQSGGTSNLILATESVISTSSKNIDAVTLVSGNQFINNNTSGISIQFTGEGTPRWLIYSNDIDNDHRGGLATKPFFNYYGCAYDSGCSVFFPNTENGFIYINQPTITVTADIQEKVYGEIDPVLTYQVDGLKNGDDFSIFIGILNRDLGEDVASYPIRQGILSTNNNYHIDYVGNNLTIKPATLNLLNFLGNKFYDGTPVFDYTQLEIDPASVLGSDDIILSSGNAEVSSRNAGIYNAFIRNDLSLSGAEAANYSVLGGSVNVVINPAALTINAITDSRVYDGTTESTGAVTFSGLQIGDTLTELTQVFDSKHAGSRTLNVSPDYVLNDGNSGLNYSVTLKSAKGTINPAALTINAVTDNRIYDGTINSSGAVLFSGLQIGDTLTELTQVFDSKHAGSRTLNVSPDYVLNDGNSGLNYSVTLNSAKGTINPVALTINAVTDNRIYDGTINSKGAVIFSGLQTGDTLTKLTQVFDSKHAGSRTLNVSPDYVLNDGNSGLNYSVTLKSANGAINLAALTINAVTDSRIYDGTINSSGAVLFSGLQTGDTLTELTQVFDSKHAGSRTLNVSPDYVLNDGNSGLNYSVILKSAKGTINPAVASLNASKIYDGTAQFSTSQINVTGIFGELLTLNGTGLATANSKQVTDNDMNYLKNLADLTLANGVNELASDYILPDLTTRSINNNVIITAADIHLLSIFGNKIYDGTPIFDYTQLEIDPVSVLGSDDIILSSGNAEVSSRNTGTYHAFIRNDLSLSGSDAANYSVVGGSVNVVINPAALTINAVTDSRIYDGTINSSGAVTFSGLQTGDTLTKLTQVFDSKHAGSRTLNVSPDYVLNDGNSGLNYSVILKSAKGTINPAVASLNASKIYDGTAQFSTSQINVTGIFGELLTLNGTGLATANSKQVTDNDMNYLKNLADLTLANGVNELASDYILPDLTTRSINNNVIITAADIHLLSIFGNKIYDGTPIFDYTQLEIDPVSVLGSDDIILSSGNAEVSNRNTGTYHAFIRNDLGLSGADAANYSVLGGSVNVVINPAALTINAVTDNRIYDGTINSNGAVIFSGLQIGDTLTELTQVFDSKHAGSRTLNVSPDYVLNDGNSGLNYSVTLNPAKGTINPIVASLNASKIYDGTAQFNTNQINVTGIFGELLTLNGTGLATANSNQVADNDVNYLKNLADLTLANGVNELASDYILPDLTTRSINNNVIITAADIHLLSIFGNKIYDGTPIFDYTQLEIDPGGVLGDDDVLLSSGNAEVSSRNAGIYNAFIRNDLSLSGAEAANYSVLGGSVNVVINPAALTINAITDSRVYDGTTESTAVVTFSGLQTGDTLTELTQVFDSKHAGSHTLNVSPDYVLNDGNSGLNYSVTLKSAKGTINPAALTINAVTDNRIYDGTINSNGALIFSGLQTGDTLTKLTQVFDSKNVGSHTLNVSPDYVLNDGNSGLNYSVILKSAKGTINPAALTINAVTDSRTYDGTINSSGAVIFSGLQTGDTLTELTQVFDSKNAGSRTLNMSPDYILNDGNSGLNYSVTLKSAKGTINPAALTINAVTDNRIYDGTINSSGAVIFSGLQTGDALTELTQVFDSKHAGSRTLNVSPDYVLNDGNSGLNYSVTLKSAKGTINPAIVLLTAAKDYDGTAQFTANQINVIGIDGELLTLTGSGLAIADSEKSDNTNYLISLNNLTLADGINGSASDYVLPDVTKLSTNSKVVITPVTITVVEQGSETGSGSTQFITRTPTRTVMTMKIDGNTSCVLVEIADLISAVANSVNLSSSYDIFKAAIASTMVTVQQTSDAEPSQSVLKQPVVIAQQEEVLQSPDIAQAINLAAIEQNPVIEKQLVTPPLVKSVNVQSRNPATKEKEKEKDDNCDPQESTFSDQFSLCRRSKK
ncbi:YDG domain-containing protein [Chromatium okenii]|uniref:YDG domain-containing protein n=1 Tax=Chromatium okenii TaxID=61644 RepID=UPI0026F356FD|nr:YDG domain-containing protein [Chromatium okenii]MBV5310987.1 filamentous hemagglutinin N-terminal domain-containing protein [Chromatium okenii]